MSDERNIIKLRGLPWNSTSKDILDFLKECQVMEGEKSVHLAISHRDGRPNGEAFVELATPDDVEKAFEYNKNVLGHRYIEIFNAKPEEFEQCLKRQNLVQQDTFIKLRGLPFSCKQDDIAEFFQGLEIRNGINGISIVFDSRGRPTGESFVQFCNSEDTDLAMKKNREKIGHRYIEIFRSSSSECRRSTIFNGNGGGRNNNNNNNNNNNSNNGPVGFNNDRMGRGQRNTRTNFRDRPYPDAPWTPSNNNSNNNSGNNDAPWRNNSRGNSNSNFGGGNNNSNNFNDNFDGGNNNIFNNDNNFSSDFERNWNSGGSNSFNSFGGGNSKNNVSSFDRDLGGFNNFSNNSNNSGSGNGNSNFGNDRFMSNGGGNMNSGGGNGGGQYAVHLRGMPYDCGENEVQQFFAPLKLVSVEILYNNNNRHTGEADAYFSTIADAQEAMKKHKEKMGSRYIELFAKSNERRGGNGGGGGGGGNNGGRF